MRTQNDTKNILISHQKQQKITQQRHQKIINTQKYDRNQNLVDSLLKEMNKNRNSKEKDQKFRDNKNRHFFLSDEREQCKFQRNEKVQEDSEIQTNLTKQLMNQEPASNKLTHIPAKIHDKSQEKKLKVNWFQGASISPLQKAHSKPSNTQSSTSTQAETLKAQNQEIISRCIQEIQKVNRLKREINQQRKIHALRKQIYKSNIQKLTKIANLSLGSKLALKDMGQSNILGDKDDSDPQSVISLSIESH